MMAMPINNFQPGDNALDVMNKAEEENAALKAELPHHEGSPMMPHEIRGKTMNQLLAMGATEISSMNHKVNWNPMPNEEDPDRDETQRKATRELALEDQEEPDFFADALGADATRFKEAMRNKNTKAKRIQGAT